MLLTIAIPTYNRCKYLSDLLESIRREWRDEYNVVCEVMVIDNASPDDTPSVVEKYAAILPLRGIRNVQNLGLQGNWRECIRNAQGTYFWIIGDDEEVATGSIENILRVIKTDQPAVIIGNYHYESEDRPLFLQSVRGKPLVEGPANSAEFVSSHGLLWTFGNYGMVVGRVDLVRAKLEVEPQYFESNFAQVFFYYEAYHQETLYFCHKAFFVTDEDAQGPNKERWKTDGTIREWFAVPRSMQLMLPRCHPEHPRRPLSFFNFCSNDWLPMWVGLYRRGFQGEGFEPDESMACIAASKQLVDLIDPTVFTELLKSNLYELNHTYRVAKELLANRTELCQRLLELSHETVLIRSIELPK
jgi:glycosyltransferase involved in cell wall biosynthesis